MKVSEKKLGDGRIQLDAVATPDEVNRALNSAAYDFAQRMGLRPSQGKTIEQLAEEQLGVKDLISIIEPQAIEQISPLAIDKRNIIPAFPPKATAKSPLRRNQGFSFRMTVTPRPDYELSSYDPVSITVEPFKMDPADVDREMDRVAEQFAEYAADAPHPVQSGDNCLLAITATKDGKPMQGLTTEGRTYTTGAGLMPDGFDENVIGMDVGETKSFSFTGPGVDDAGNEVNEIIDCTVTVKEIQKRVIPAITDEWVQRNMPMYHNADEFRENVRKQVEKTRRDEYENYRLRLAATELAKRFSGSIADEVYESMQQSMLRDLRDNLKQQGMTLEEFVEQNGGQQQFNIMFMVQIRAALVQGYALDALFRHEGMILTNEDMDEASKVLNPQNPRMVRQQMESTGRRFALREIAERMKANRWLLDHANVTVSEPDK